MLDQATPREGVCEICQVVTKSGRWQMELRVRTVRLSGLVIPEYDLGNSHDFDSRQTLNYLFTSLLDSSFTTPLTTLTTSS
jgi:hypothetical protein